MRVVHNIRVPARIITADDDPFVPTMPFNDARVIGNPRLNVTVTRHGGHCAFLSEARQNSDGYWAESEILAFATEHTRATAARSGGLQTPAPVPALRA
jgi:predicted alpha/beta-fold hydrolase